jgi:hypothetical protein
MCSVMGVMTQKDVHGERPPETHRIWIPQHLNVATRYQRVKDRGQNISLISTPPIDVWGLL